MLLSPTATDRDCPIFNLTLTDDELEGDLVPLGLLDLLVHVTRSRHAIDPSHPLLQLALERPAIISLLFTNGDERDLRRRTPHREVPREVLDQAADEALEALRELSS